MSLSIIKLANGYRTLQTGIRSCKYKYCLKKEDLQGVPMKGKDFDLITNRQNIIVSNNNNNNNNKKTENSLKLPKKLLIENAHVCVG